jgi:hypothetical protein
MLHFLYSKLDTNELNYCFLIGLFSVSNNALLQYIFESSSDFLSIILDDYSIA